MSLGLLFPGQGTQHAAMLPWLGQDTRPLHALALMEQAIGTDWRARLSDPAWATRNDVAQILLTGVCLAAWETLQPLLPAPTVVAGYSVGELAAFSAAGVFEPEIALQLAPQRAHGMDACVQGRRTGLLSVASGPAGSIDRLCLQHALSVAIRLGPERCILGGLVDDLAAAEQDASQTGATCKRLAVSIASHTAWLRDAVPGWTETLEGCTFARPQAVLVCNESGTALRQPVALRQALARQIARPVLWDQCMDTLAERRPDCVLEIGPGATLARLWNERHPAIPARSIDDFKHPAAVAAWVRQVELK